MEEAEIYAKASLVQFKLGDVTILIKHVSLDHTNSDGVSNKVLLKEDRNPVDENGELYYFHHIGQRNDSPLALLSHSQHYGKNYKIGSVHEWC